MIEREACKKQLVPTLSHSTVNFNEIQRDAINNTPRHYRLKTKHYLPSWSQLSHPSTGPAPASARWLQGLKKHRLSGRRTPSHRSSHAKRHRSALATAGDRPSHEIEECIRSIHSQQEDSLRPSSHLASRCCRLQCAAVRRIARPLRSYTYLHHAPTV